MVEKDAGASAAGSEGEEKAEPEPAAQPIPEPKKVSGLYDLFFLGWQFFTP